MLPTGLLCDEGLVKSFGTIVGVVAVNVGIYISLAFGLRTRRGNQMGTVSEQCPYL